MSYKYDHVDRSKCSWLISAEYFLKENYLAKDNYLLKDTYGFKFGGYLTVKKFFNLGYTIACFTDFTDYKVAFTPEIGIGYKSIFLVYSRDLTLWKSGLDNLSKDNLSIKLYIPLDKRWF